MTFQPSDDSTGKRGISRRDFFLGRFLQPFDSDDALPRERKRRFARPLIMRYPRTLREAAENDPRDSYTAPGAPAELPPPAARRRTIPVLRPPGAIDEESFLRGCTRCELCIQACPHNAIIHAPARLREVAGTPMIDADHQPCMMCADFPCIAVCEPGVLTRLIPPAMGTARVTQHLCVAHHGTICTVCSEQCPVEGAIVLTDRKPAVSEANCTGCGVCRYVCPAPENAILLMPTFIRPSPPNAAHDA